METDTRTWSLEIVAPDGSRRVEPLTGGVVTVGRSKDARVRLDSVAVSRDHAQLVPATDGAGGWRLVDSGSRNGTIVNGQIVRDRPLAPGDRIQIGGFELTVQGPHGSSRTPPAHAPAAGNPSTSVVLVEAAGKLETLSAAAEPPRLAASHLDKLNDFSRALLALPDPGNRAAELCRLFTDLQFRGDPVLLLRVHRPAPDRAPAILWDVRPVQARPVPHREPYVSRSLLRAAVERGEPVLASNAHGAAATPADADVRMSIAVSVMSVAAVACPVRTTPDEIDLLYVALPPECGTSEWLALTSLAVKQYQLAEQAWDARAAAAAAAALEREVEHAAQIQHRLLPGPARLAACRAAGVDVAIGFYPCRSVGGDYADVLCTGDGRVLVVTADVCGHGLAASLVTAAVHTLVHAAARAGSDVGALANAINQHLCETLSGQTFVTFVGVSLDPRDGSAQVVNAGHPPPFVFAADGQTRRLPAGVNLPFGLDPEPPQVHDARLAPGDVLVLYTDGLTEQTDDAGQPLGLTGLETALTEVCATAAADPRHVADCLSNLIRRRQSDHPRADDQSFLIATRAW
jgi:hypothetical protein